MKTNRIFYKNRFFFMKLNDFNFSRDKIVIFFIVINQDYKLSEGKSSRFGIRNFSFHLRACDNIHRELYIAIKIRKMLRN